MTLNIRKYAERFNITPERKFGILFAIVFFIITFYPLLKGHSIRGWSSLVAVGFLLLTILFPGALKPLNDYWIKLGGVMHAIISPIALGIIFYFVVFPVGILMRLFGKHQLNLHYDTKLKSYWIKRDPPGPTAKSFDNQF